MIATSIQLAQSRWNIAARTRTPRKTRRDRFYYRSANNVYTNFMYSPAQLTTTKR